MQSCSHVYLAFVHALMFPVTPAFFNRKVRKVGAEFAEEYSYCDLLCLIWFKNISNVGFSISDLILNKTFLQDGMGFLAFFTSP
jgi:hypothetical protein